MPIDTAADFDAILFDCDGTLDSGRAEDETGAHAAGHNARSLGICLAGTGRFTPAQWQSLSTLVRSLHARHPAARLCGHRDLSPDRNGDGVVSPAEWTKTCPGFSVADWRPISSMAAASTASSTASRRRASRQISRTGLTVPRALEMYC